MSRKSPAQPASAEHSTARQLRESDLKRIAWRSVGPASMGGRIADMAFAPNDPKTFFIGYATGGIWKTTNRGTTFSPIFDDQETCSIGSLAVCDAPENWKGWKESDKKEDRAKSGKAKIIWVGTGEGNGRNSSSWGNGVYRSTDGGAKWDHLGLEDAHDIPRLAVDPRDPDTCYIAALGHLWGPNETRGVYKTTDGGQTWTPVLQIDENTGACEVAIDPSNPDTVFAAMYMRRRSPYSFMSGGPEGGLYKSTDAGKTWRKLAGGLPSQTGRIGIDIWAKDSKRMIAVVESTESGANSIRDDRMRGGGVFRSNDGGETWRRLSVRSPRAFYFSKIKFDPSDDQRIYMLGWTTEVSIDGGETFSEGMADILHADHHAILIDPADSDHVIIGTDGGVYQSFDKSKTWDFLNTMATGQFYNVSLDMSEPYRIIGGLQDNGTWVGPSATNREMPKNEAMGLGYSTGITNSDWQDVFWGDGFHADFDPTDNNWVYAEWQGGHITRINMATGEKRYLSPEAREGEPRHRYNWNSPFFVSRHDPKTIYHAGNSVFKLTERGDKWTRISGDLTTADPKKMDTSGSTAENYCTIVSLCESPMKAGILWAGSDDGLIHVTKDDGKSWKNVTPTEVAGMYVSRLQASAFEQGRCYATIDGHRSDWMHPMVLVTEDFGKTWSDITSNLPKGRSALVIREDQSNPNVLYVGSEGGTFVSLDRGENWVKFHGKGLPTVPVDDIKQHSRETDIVIATHGRSIWVLDGAGWIGELTPEVISKPLHLFSIASTRPQWMVEYSGLWTHKVFRAQNPPSGVKIDYWIAEYIDEEVSITIENDKGVVVKKMGGGNAAGYHRAVWDLQPQDWQRLADKGEDPFMDFHVAPGTYTVKLKMGDHKVEGTFTVLARKD